MTVFISCRPRGGRGPRENEHLIIQTLIPLWGTWTGTILAFYFCKNNFEAAARSYEHVINQLKPHEKMAKLLVKDYMIPHHKLEYLTYDDVKNEPISKILKYEQFDPYKRFAVFDNAKAAKYIIHRSLIHQFIASQVDKGMETKQISELTLLEFLENKTIRNILKNNLAILSMDATLLEAKTKIDSIEECLDVFITKTGAEDEAVEGLITNNIILKAASV